MNTNTPERALRQVVREASAFYLLGYASTRNPQDGKFHKIGVKVKRSGLDLRARRGYWAPNATEIEKARTEAAAADAIPADMTGAMACPGDGAAPNGSSMCGRAPPAAPTVSRR